MLPSQNRRPNPSPVEIFLIIALIITAGIALTGCATITTTLRTICDNQYIVRDQAERQIENANDIADPTKRAAVLAIASFTIAGLEKCPKIPA